MISTADLQDYTPLERMRIEALLETIPRGRATALDIGAREGYVTRLLTALFDHVTALDLEMPHIEHDRVENVAGDVTALQYEDSTFDTVICSEVLEHIPPARLQKACDEIVRVARHDIVVGVPFLQDRRVGRLTCRSCGKAGPAWGHLNSFSRKRLGELFRSVTPVKETYAGENRTRTNALSTFLLDLAGNPWGPYDQEERCVHCRAKLVPPERRSLSSRVASGIAMLLNRAQQAFVRPRPTWIHIAFSKRPFREGGGTALEDRLQARSHSPPTVA